jgi:hypothetical protein
VWVTLSEHKWVILRECRGAVEPFPICRSAGLRLLCLRSHLGGERTSLARHPRFQIHFTSTGASWLNMVERFFRDLTEHRLCRGVFRDVEELITAIDEYVDRHNEDPKPFIWTAKACDIPEKVKRARGALNNVQSV